jgi:hypothetical protein
MLMPVNERVNRLKGKIRAKTTLLSAMRGSAVFKDYVGTLEEALHDERERFENNDANEYTRGRISMLKDLLEEIK